MARYYVERQKDGRIESVIAQDDTGIYLGRKDGSAVRVVQHDRARETTIQSRDTGEIRIISNTTLEYLDHMRRFYRHPAYWATTPSEIEELPGSAEEVIRKVLTEAVLV